MVEVPIRLTAYWVALMLTYLLGDVIRIFAGDFEAGTMAGVKASPALWMVAALIMLVPIAMLIVSVTFSGEIARWAHIGAAAGLFAFNALSLMTYPGLYDRFLLVVGLGINALTIWTAWGWADAA
jgi:hypothetical protein